jgi:hypothetical protein
MSNFLDEQQFEHFKRWVKNRAAETTQFYRDAPEGSLMEEYQLGASDAFDEVWDKLVSYDPKRQ